MKFKRRTALALFGGESQDRFDDDRRKMFGNREGVGGGEPQNVHRPATLSQFETETVPGERLA
jgi:hypothetical protein